MSSIKNNNSIVRQSSIYSNLLRLPNPSKVLKDQGKTIEVFHSIIKQPDVFAVVQNYRDAINNMELSISDEFISDYIRSVNFFRWSRLACAARDYGFCILEVVEYDYFQNKLVPTKIEICPPEKFAFSHDHTLLFFPANKPQGIDIMKEYPNKFILIQFEPTLTNPYGTALLDPAYWLAIGLNGNFEFLLTFLEEDGRDKWIVEHPSSFSEEQKQELLNKALELRNGGIATIPEGTQLRNIPMTTRSSSGSLYIDADEMLRRKIEKLWFGTDLTMQTQGKGGYSSSQSGLDIREESLAQGRELVIYFIRQLVTIIENLNRISISPDLNISMFSPRSTSKEEAEVDQIYFAMGLRPNQKFFEEKGYDPAQFTLQAPTTSNANAPILHAPNSDFAADTPDIDELIRSFEIFKSDAQKQAKQGKNLPLP